MNAIPTLRAWETLRGDLIVWCMYCDTWHFHADPGGRHLQAHCDSPRSPYRDSGYILDSKGPAPPDVEVDICRRRPRGVS